MCLLLSCNTNIRRGDQNLKSRDYTIIFKFSYHSPERILQTDIGLLPNTKIHRADSRIVQVHTCKTGDARRRKIYLEQEREKGREGKRE